MKLGLRVDDGGWNQGYRVGVMGKVTVWIRFRVADEVGVRALGWLG